MSNSLKMALVQEITAPIIIPEAKIGDETKVRFVIENAAGGNTIVVRARIQGQDSWDDLATITGNAKQVVNVTTYDYIQIECTVYASLANYVKVIASSFNEASGSTSIDAPSGGTIDSDSINFTSSDGSVDIVADPLTNTIDFRSTGAVGGTKYVRTVALSDWAGPSAGEYVLNIPFAQHSKSNPVVTCMESNGSEFETIEVVTVLNNNDIRLIVLSAPDTRFAGKIFID